MTTWDEFDQMVTVNVSKEYADAGMLRAHISVLLVKNVINYQTNLDEVRQYLAGRYDVEYELSDIESEMIDMKYDEEQEMLGNDVIEYEEDYYDGY